MQIYGFHFVKLIEFVSIIHEPRNVLHDIIEVHEMDIQFMIQENIVLVKHYTWMRRMCILY